MMNKNPWAGFRYSDSMLHPDDAESVEFHNSSSKADYQFLLHLAPEPWIGSLQGNLLVLYSNPGATQDNLNKVLQLKHNEVMEKSISNLNQEITSFPHFHFDPELKDTEGGKWFRSKYRWLIEETSDRAVSENLITCELAPYHSVKWKIPRRKLPTQEFTYEIIRNAMSRDAVILLARTPKVWLENLPELEKYPKMFRPNSINASISPKNYPGNFDKIIEAVI
jgi:hypothetical protein